MKKSNAYRTAIECVIESNDIGSTLKAEVLKHLYRDLSFAERREQEGDNGKEDSK